MIKDNSSRETEKFKSQMHAWVRETAGSKPRVLAAIYGETGRDIRYLEAGKLGSWGSLHLFFTVHCSVPG
jgi:hypothetical protein